MRCYKHYDREAVSQCNDCTKALCPDCTSKYTTPLCDECVLKRVSNDKVLLIKNIIIMVAGFVFGFVFQSDPSSKILFGLLCAGVPWGWSALSRITPNIFLIMPLIGWVIYFFIKLTLSMIIGIFVTPFKIYQIIKGFKQAKALTAHATTING